MRFVTRTRVFACGFVALAAAGLSAGAGPAAPASHLELPAPATGTDFHPMTPTRVLNTRDGQGAKVGPGGTVTINLKSLVPHAADFASSVVLNVTVTDVTAPTYVTAWYGGNTAPTTSSLNLLPGQTRANLVTTATTNGDVAFYNHAGSVDIIADIEGYYAPTGGAEFTAVSPARVLDSRSSGSFAANATHQLSLAGHVPSNATAVALNVTGLDAVQSTYVSVWPAGGARPSVSNVNLDPGETVPNQVIVGLGANSTISIYNHVGRADVLVDIAGYYTTATPSSFEVAGSGRVLDTRHGSGPVGPNGVITLDLSGAVPPTTTAVVLNLTGTDVTARTYVTAWPDGGNRPVASSLNLSAGQTAANLVTVAVSPDGRVDLYNHVGTIDLVADLAGYFAPPASSCVTGCMVGWGMDVEGSVGDRRGGGETLTPTALFGTTGLQSVASTHGQIGYGLGTDGSVWTWGLTSDVPVRVPGITSVEAISAAASGGFGLRSDGTVWSFGDVSAITGNTGTAPVQIAGLTGVTAIASGANDLFALRADGTVSATGDNSHGQLGNGTTCTAPCHEGPVQVAGLTNVTAISGGFLDGFALRSDGTVWSWGYNAKGLHTGTDSGSSNQPLQVIGLTGVTAIASGNSTSIDNGIKGSDEFGYARKSDGTVWSWGYNVRGQLGNGSHAKDPTWSFTPSQVSGLTGVTAISAGTDSGYALLSDGTARAWGSDTSNVLDDSREDGQSDVPVVMPDLAGATAIFGGYEAAFALFPDGR